MSYTELVQGLREHAERFDYDGWVDTAIWFEQAADAIENVSKAYRMMAEAYEAEVTKQDWISVTERLPERNTWVLAYCKYKGHVIDYVDINGLWSYGNVTHWMPLPEPPKEE